MDEPNVGAQFIRAIYIQLRRRTMNLDDFIIASFCLIDDLLPQELQPTLSVKPQQEPFSLPHNIYAFVP